MKVKICANPVGVNLVTPEPVREGYKIAEINGIEKTTQGERDR